MLHPYFASFHFREICALINEGSFDYDELFRYVRDNLAPSDTEDFIEEEIIPITKF